LPAIGALVIGSIIVWHQFLGLFGKKYSHLAFGMLCIGAIFSTFGQDFQEKYQENELTRHNLESDCEFLKQFIADDQLVLVNGVHIVKYYLNNPKNFDELHRYRIDKPAFFRRINYEYIDVTEDIKNHKIKAIVMIDWANYSKEELQKLENFGYISKKLNQYTVYYLPN
jgi:hypothetical protein